MGAAKDYTGQKFNRLTAIERIPERGGQTRYKCICDCGQDIVVNGGHLASGATKSCGCWNVEQIIRRNKEQARKLDQPQCSLIGKRFGRLIVIQSSGERNTSDKFMSLCRCDCGNETLVVDAALRSGHTKSCGCLAAELRGSGSRTHGKSKSAEYGPWSAMWARCTNPNHAKYEQYKDRCPPPEWRDFAVFFRDMGPRPSPQHSIERIKNGQPYGPQNCRWATPSEQCRNQEKTVRVEFNGQVVSLADACDELGIEYKRSFRQKGNIKAVEMASNGLIKQVTQYDNTNFL